MTFPDICLCAVEPGKLPTTPSRFAALWRWLRRLLPCKHAWNLFSDHRYHITDRDGRMVGEVSLAIYVCEHCDSQKCVPHNRTP